MTRREWCEIAELVKRELAEWEAARGLLIDDVVDGAIAALVSFAIKRAVALSTKHARFDMNRFLIECGIKRP